LSLGWSTAILRAERASARTECPASRAAFTVSRPIPLLAPMIRTVATAHAPGRPAWLAVMCAAGSCAGKMGGRLKLHFQAAHVRQVEAARSHSGRYLTPSPVGNFGRRGGANGGTAAVAKADSPNRARSVV
jgi:hypothetical protein